MLLDKSKYPCVAKYNELGKSNLQKDFFYPRDKYRDSRKNNTVQLDGEMMRERAKKKQVKALPAKPNLQIVRNPPINPIIGRINLFINFPLHHTFSTKPIL